MRDCGSVERPCSRWSTVVRLFCFPQHARMSGGDWATPRTPGACPRLARHLRRSPLVGVRPVGVRYSLSVRNRRRATARPSSVGVVGETPKTFLRRRARPFETSVPARPPIGVTTPPAHRPAAVPIGVRHHPPIDRRHRPSACDARWSHASARPYVDRRQEHGPPLWQFPTIRCGGLCNRCGARCTHDIQPLGRRDGGSWHAAHPRHRRR